VDSESRQPSASDRTTVDFLRLLSQHERRMKAYILALVPNWADADDLYQETTVRLWEQFPGYDPKQEFGAWACTIAYYMVLAHRKKSNREKGRFSQAFAEAVAEEVAATSQEADLRYHALQRCLRKLSERNRDLIRHCYSGTNTLKAVAEQMGRNVNALYKALSRIRHALHECIEKKLQEEGAV
jgi:RNA polymerase sigma-70 factor (ECF subfamily)